MSSGIFNIGLNNFTSSLVLSNSNSSLVISKGGTMTLDFSKTGPAGYQVPSARTITAGVGLTGGGTLASDITIDAEFGTTAGTICQGNDARLSDARTPTSHTHPASEISDSTAAGRTILTAADAAAQRTALGLGTVATQNANNVTLTGGTLQGVGVVTGSYTSNANEAILRSCRKASAGTITKGQVVYIVGSTGVHLTVELSDADTESTSSKTFGIAAENITNSTEGYVMVEGLLTGLSNLPSTSFADGDALWLSSTTGGWQNTPPANPAHGVYLGRVIKASNGSNAQAYIRIQNGYELNELHDVVIASPLDTHSLFYETSSGLWKNRRPALSDISQSSATTGQFSEWNGSAWAAASITASDISDSTVAGRAILTAADAAAQRTSLGLGSAALRADTDFPRFDADQSATATQKRTARRNIGFSDSFTTAELLALSATESEKLRVAFCSDCFTSGATTANLLGDICIWSGDRWLTFHDKVPPSTDWLAFSLAVARIGTGTSMGPFMSVHGDLANNILAIGQYLNGTSAVSSSLAADGERLMNFGSFPGTTSTGSFKGVPVFGVYAGTGVPTRKTALLLNFFGSAAAVSNVGVDEWHWRLTCQTPLYTASASLQNDDFGFVMDDRNTLGQGSTGSNLYAMCRLNGTTTDWVNTGLLAASASAHLIVTWEPTGSFQGRIRIASAGDFGTPITTHIDRTGSLSAGAANRILPCLNGAKTLGTGGTRAVSRRWIKTITLRTSVGSGSVIS